MKKITAIPEIITIKDPIMLIAIIIPVKDCEVEVVLTSVDVAPDDVDANADTDADTDTDVDTDGLA